MIDSKTQAMDGERLKQLFPRRDDIPVEFRAPAPVHQRHVLLDGALVPWSGPCQAVVSPIRFRDPAGALEQVELGSYPEGGEAEAEAALARRVAAYDNGRGAWPTMTVAERIACMQDFTKQMVRRSAPRSCA